MPMKRPAASGSAGGPKKKPAGKINETIDNLRRGVSSTMLDEEPEEEDSTKDEEEGDGESRDKSKGQKYAKLKNSNSLPAHVIDLVERQSAVSPCPRSFKTHVINKLFKKGKGGKLTLDLDNELFAEHKKIYNKKFNTEKETALPESILKGLYFQNNQQAFEAARDAGDIQPVEGASALLLGSFACAL